MKTFEFEMTFAMRCATRGYTIPAKTEAEAIKKIESCLDPDGGFDFAEFEKLGGQADSWDTLDGSDYDYEFDGDINEE